MVGLIKQKRGIIKLVETFIAITIIAGVMIFIYTTQIKKPDQADRVDKIETIILEKISEDQSLRQAVLYGNHSDDLTSEAIGNRSIINDTIGDLMPEDFAFLFKICKLDEICGLDYSPSYYTKNEIYVKEKSISSTLEEYKPRKVKLFVWLNN